MRVGYFAMPLHPPGADPAQTMEEDLEQLVTLEGLGFEEAWIGEPVLDQGVLEGEPHDLVEAPQARPSLWGLPRSAYALLCAGPVAPED